MAVVATPPLQGSLWGAQEPALDVTFGSVERLELSRGAWVDHAPGWLAGSDTLFDHCLQRFPWQEGEQWMYDRMVAMPRRYARVLPDEAAWPPVLDGVVAALHDRYGIDLPGCGANLYRHGDDSVAWHGDRIGRRRLTSTVALLSLGEPRRFLLRPKGGGPSVRFDLGRGDLLVMGGTCQRTWEHAVPKCRRAGPRISLAFRDQEDRPRVRLSPA